MPDYEGRLDEGEYNFVLGKLEQFRPGLRARCPVSGDTNWIVGDYLVHTPTHTGQWPVVGGPAYLYVQVICQSCGYTMFLNAVLFGLIPQGGVANVS